MLTSCSKVELVVRVFVLFIWAFAVLKVKGLVPGTWLICVRSPGLRMKASVWVQVGGRKLANQTFCPPHFCPKPHLRHQWKLRVLWSQWVVSVAWFCRVRVSPSVHPPPSLVTSLITTSPPSRSSHRRLTLCIHYHERLPGLSCH